MNDSTKCPCFIPNRVTSSDSFNKMSIFNVLPTNYHSGFDNLYSRAFYFIKCTIKMLLCHRDYTQNLAGRQGGQKTVNMTGLGPQSDKFQLVNVFLVIWSIFDQFLTSQVFISPKRSKTRCFRRHRGDGFGSSKICRLDNFLTSFLGPRFCVYRNKVSDTVLMVQTLSNDQ